MALVMAHLKQIAAELGGAWGEISVIFYHYLL